jgi:ribosomal protein S18 acetylase RimI-like enzyme
MIVGEGKIESCGVTRRQCETTTVATPARTTNELLEQALLVERHHAEWFIAEGAIPGTEVHRDRDVTWIVHPGAFWRNAGILLRFTPASAARRLDIMVARYRAHGRGMALWVGPATTPHNLTDLLKARGLRCQKYYPAMVRSLSDVSTIGARPVTGLEIRRVEDVNVFRTKTHPSIGPISTALRRQALERLRALTEDRAEGTLAFVAWLNGRPVGACELFLGSAAAGLHSLSVPSENRGRGIGRALLQHACERARERGATTIVLLASSEGQLLYSRSGFCEVARFGYWSRSFRRRNR